MGVWATHGAWIGIAGALGLLAAGCAVETGGDAVRASDTGASSKIHVEALHCPPGLLDCNGVCVDPLTDVDNCGACGNTCIATTCSSGVCPTPGTTTHAPLLPGVTSRCDGSTGGPVSYDMTTNVPWTCSEVLKSTNGTPANACWSQACGWYDDDGNLIADGVTSGKWSLIQTSVVCSNGEAHALIAVISLLNDTASVDDLASYDTRENFRVSSDDPCDLDPEAGYVNGQANFTESPTAVSMELFTGNALSICGSTGDPPPKM